MSSKVATGERDGLGLEVNDLKKNNANVVATVIDLETGQECKHENIDHLAFM